VGQDGQRRRHSAKLTWPKGEKPAELTVLQGGESRPGHQSQTVKTLGLDVPATVLARADEVIE